MVVTEKHFDELAYLYEDLIHRALKLHNVREVVCKNEKEHYFDRIELTDKRMKVYNHLLKESMSGLYFDFTNDYARCLSYIEDDLYLALRNGKPEHGMYFKFNNKK